MTFVAVAAGLSHTCAVDTQQRAFCWGGDSYGQLGDGTGNSGGPTPRRVAGDALFLDIAAGENHTCALDTQDAIWCWGANSAGQVGDGTFLHRAQPTPVASGGRFSTISCGRTHCCALSLDGSAYCWGSNARGELAGEGFHSTPVEVSSPEAS